MLHQANCKTACKYTYIYVYKSGVPDTLYCTRCTISNVHIVYMHLCYPMRHAMHHKHRMQHSTLFVVCMVLFFSFFAWNIVQFHSNMKPFANKIINSFDVHVSCCVELLQNKTKRSGSDNNHIRVHTQHTEHTEHTHIPNWMNNIIKVLIFFSFPSLSVFLSPSVYLNGIL